MDNDLVNFVNGSRASGKTDQEIVVSLLKSGWQQNQIDQALSSAPKLGDVVTPLPGQAMIVNNKPPYPFNWTLIISLFFGLWGGYFIVWQNLKRIGKEDVAKKFLVWAGIGLFVVYLLVANYYRDTGSMVGTTLAGIIFPVWFNNKYGRAWNNENPGVTKFQWSLVGWGALGVPATMIFGMIVAIIFGIE